MATDRELIAIRTAVRKALLSVTVMEWGGSPIAIEDKVDWLAGEIWKEVVKPMTKEVAHLRQEVAGLQDHTDALEAEMHDPDDCVVLSLVERTHDDPPEASR